MIIRSVLRAVSVYCNGLYDFHHKLLVEEREIRNGCARRQIDGSPRLPLPSEVLEAPYGFVLSTGRCGTSLLTKILAESPRLSVEHHPEPGLDYVSSLIHHQAPTTEGLTFGILAARFDMFCRAYLRRRMYVETNNRITFFAPALVAILPNAKFIHLVRHPADFVRSGMRRGYYQEGNIQYQRLRPKNETEWTQMSRLEKIAWEWNEINAAIEVFKKQCGPARVLTVKSENLFRDTKVTQNLFEFLGVPEPYHGTNASAQYARLLKKRVNAQKQGTFPSFANWTDQDKASLSEYATAAPLYGYELQ